MSTVTVQSVTKACTHAFKFGALEFRTRGLGVFFPSDKLTARIQALSTDELRAANRAAWKMRREAGRAMERSPTMSQWDLAAHDESVARAICNTTWQAMRGRP